jgi:hypothetical protein
LSVLGEGRAMDPSVTPRTKKLLWILVVGLALAIVAVVAAMYLARPPARDNPLVEQVVPNV